MQHDGGSRQLVHGSEAIDDVPVGVERVDEQPHKRNKSNRLPLSGLHDRNANVDCEHWRAAQEPAVNKTCHGCNNQRRSGAGTFVLLLRILVHLAHIQRTAACRVSVVLQPALRG